MKISSSFTNNDCNKHYSNSFKGNPVNPVVLPNCIHKLGELAGKYVALPENRLLLGATAIILQPLIDLHFSEDDKKVDSAIKSTSKAFAGATVGVSVRALFTHLINSQVGFEETNPYTGKLTPKVTKLNKLLFPKGITPIQEGTEPIIYEKMEKYKSTLGGLIAILVMLLYTNKHFDVPLTNIIQDVVSGVAKENKSWIKSISDVCADRKNKIKNSYDTKINKIKEIKNRAKKALEVISPHKSSVDNNGDDE